MLHFQTHPPPFLSCFLSHSLHTTVHTHTHTPLFISPLPVSSRPLGLWSSGVRWVGGLVGGTWGGRAKRAGIQSNMHREITIAPLGDLQMLAVQAIVVGSYRYANISWESVKQHIQPTDQLPPRFAHKLKIKMKNWILGILTLSLCVLNINK